MQVARISGVLLLAWLGACAGGGGKDSGKQEARSDSSGTAAPPPPAAALPDSGAATFRVAGTEPFWALEITRRELRFITPEDTSGIRFSRGGSVTSGDTLRWSATAHGTTIEARIWPSQCSDGMSDRVWTHRAVVRVDSTTYRGCAVQT
jgi:uncharacterized membrane protein